MTDFYRAANAELEVRSSGEGASTGRIIEGLAVPYGVRQRIDESLTEQFERGAFAHMIELAHRAQAPGGRPSYRVRFAREHVKQGGVLIGKTISLEETERGLVGAWQVSKTAAGDEALELARDGALNELSIGFRAAPGWSRRLPDGTVSRTRADLFEVSLVMEGAYAQAAAVEAVRAAQDQRDRLARARTLAAGWPMLSPSA